MNPYRLALVGALVVVYALCYSAIKAGLADAPALEFAGLRAGAAGALLLGVAAIRSGTFLPPRRLWAGVVALALLGTTLGYGAMFLAPGRTGAGISSVLGNTGALFLGILGWLFLGEPLGRAKVEGLLVGALGVTLIAYPAVSEPALSGAAAALIPLTSAVTIAGSAVILKRMSAGDSLPCVIAWQLLLGALPLLAVSFWWEGGSRVEWTPTFVLLLAFLATIGTAAATWTWYWLVQREDVGRLGVFMFAVPLIGLVLAWLLFDEPVSARTVVGAALTVGAVLRVAMGDRVPYVAEAPR